MTNFQIYTLIFVATVISGCYGSGVTIRVTEAFFEQNLEDYMITKQDKQARVMDVVTKHLLAQLNGRPGFSIKNPKTKLVDPKSSVELRPGVVRKPEVEESQPVGGATISITEAQLELTTQLSYRMKYFGFHIVVLGGVKLTISDFSFILPLDFGIDSNGRPTVETTLKDCESHIKVNVEFSGSSVFLLKMLWSSIKEEEETKLETSLCKEAVKRLVDFDLYSSPLKMKFPGQSLVADYSVVAIITTVDYVDLYHKGEVLSTEVQAPSGLVVLPELMPDMTSKTVGVWLSDYTINSMLRIMHQDSYYIAMLNIQNLVDGVHNTSEETVDDMNNYYKIDIYTTQPPMVNIQYNFTTLSFSCVLDHLSHGPNGTTESICTVVVNATMYIEFTFNGRSLILVTTFPESVETESDGDRCTTSMIDPVMLESVLQMFWDKVGLGAYNNSGKHVKLPLPIDILGAATSSWNWTIEIFKNYLFLSPSDGDNE